MYGTCPGFFKILSLERFLDYCCETKFHVGGNRVLNV